MNMFPMKPCDDLEWPCRSFNCSKYF